MIIAKEIHPPFKIPSNESELPVFARIDIDKKSHIKDLSLMAPWVTPIIVKNIILHPSRFDQASLVLEYVQCARALVELGFSRIVIGADGDGALQKILSPRFSTSDINQRIEPLLKIFLSLRAIAQDVLVLLTVEELAPGGLDATDGIFIAKTLQKQGLKEVIVTCGTGDFMPLYDRRITKKKHNDREDFSSNEPSMASALWLLENSDLLVWCLTFIDDKAHAMDIATSMGLAGLIEKVR